MEFIGVEAAGDGIDSGRHSATLAAGRPGVLHGAMSYLLQDDDGQVSPAHSISAGLDYPGVGPEHSYLKEIGRAEYVSVTDEDALAAFHCLSDLEGIIPALESAHAIAHVLRIAADYRELGPLLVCLSGRGDKDVTHIARVDFFTDQQDSVLFDREIQPLDFLPKLLEGLTKAGDEALPNRVVLVVELKSPKGLAEHNKKPPHLGDRKVVAFTPILCLVRDLVGDIRGPPSVEEEREGVQAGRVLGVLQRAKMLKSASEPDCSRRRVEKPEGLCRRTRSPRVSTTPVSVPNTHT